MHKPRKVLRIGITIGDLNGIGPEIVIRAFNETKLKELCTPIIYGSSRVLNVYRKLLHVEKFSYNVVQHPNQATPRKISVIEAVTNGDRVEPGIPSQVAGMGAYEALVAATKDLKEGELDALVTLPIDKSTIQNKDFRFPGHTEYLTQAFGADDSLMLMVSERCKVGVVTGHIPIRDVSNAISIPKIVAKIRLMHETLRTDFSVERPKIAVLGLNPHAGDHGLIGREDQEKVQKAVEQAFHNKILALGPFSADGFFQTGLFAQFDGILAMYHDQGLIPFKLLSGFEGTNFTAGLPFVRTSPDHGVAYDLAGKGEASLDSFNHAIYTAIDVYRNRQDFAEIEAESMWKVKAKDKDRGKPRHQPREEPQLEPELVSTPDLPMEDADDAFFAQEEE